MNLDLVVQVGAVLVGLAIAGEGIALLVGMHLLSGRNKPWVSLRNDVLLACDLIAGSALVVVAAAGALPGPAFWLVAAVALLAHAYREWEYVAGRANRFCINRPLLAMNTAKLAGLAAILALANITAV